jgi:hypothetical protein
MPALYVRERPAIATDLDARDVARSKALIQNP